MDSNEMNRLIVEAKKEKLRERYLKTKGITLEQYNHQTERQCGLCQICKTVSDKRLVIDIDLVTGFKRGLICRTCRLVLTYVKDNPLLLQAMIDHINHFRDLYTKPKNSAPEIVEDSPSLDNPEQS